MVQRDTDSLQVVLAKRRITQDEFDRAFDKDVDSYDRMQMLNAIALKREEIVTRPRPAATEWSDPGTEPFLVAGDGAPPLSYRQRSQAALTQLLDTPYKTGAERTEMLEQALADIKGILEDYRANPDRQLQELLNFEGMRRGERGVLGREYLAAPRTVDGVEVPSVIETAAGSIFTKDALTFGSILASPLAKMPGSFRASGDAMGAMMALLSLTDPDVVVANLREMANERVKLPGSEQEVYTFEFTSRRDTAATIVGVLGAAPALKAGTALQAALNAGLSRASVAVQGALARIAPNVRMNPIEPELSRGAPIPGGAARTQLPSVPPDEFLAARGISDPALRQKLIDAGLRTELLDPDATPTTLARFNKLFVETVEEGKSFGGRLGNIDTRVATINKAAELERAGYQPRFEYPVDVGAGERRYVDLVGVNGSGQPVEFYQFVKENKAGVIIRSDELTAAQEIEKALKLPPGTVQLRNTKPKAPQ
jgi:hypothetical protein